MKLLVPLVMCCSAGVGLAETHGQRVVAAVLLAEARSEGPRGMIAVAEVIRNRADAWKVSPLAVVKVDKHFTCLNNTDPQELVRRARSMKEWNSGLAIARLMYNSPEQLPGYSNGANHFHSGTADWAEGKQPVAVIGKLKFYRFKLGDYFKSSARPIYNTAPGLALTVNR